MPFRNSWILGFLEFFPRDRCRQKSGTFGTNICHQPSGINMLHRGRGSPWETLWWPAHRPLQVFESIGVTPGGGPVYRMVDWSKGVPGTPAGDLKMVTEWSKLGFVVRNPAVSDKP